MKTRYLNCLGLLTIALWQSPLAWGATDIWQFQGVLTKGYASGVMTPGTPYSFRFDVSTPPLPQAQPGLYFPTTYFSFNAGTYGYTGGIAGGGVLIANDQPLSGGGSFDGMMFSLSTQDSGFPANSPWDGTATGITLVSDSPGTTAAPFSDTSLPSTLDLNQFSQRTMTLYFNTGGVITMVQGSIESLYINGVLQVPEPSCLGLLALACLSLGAKPVIRRKR